MCTLDERLLQRRRDDADEARPVERAGLAGRLAELPIRGRTLRRNLARLIAEESDDSMDQYGTVPRDDLRLTERDTSQDFFF